MIEEDLSYLSLSNVPGPFDPRGVISVATMMGLNELEDLEDEMDLRERWKVYTKAKDSAEDKVKSRRLENASWRLWSMERVRGGDLNKDLSEGVMLRALGESESREASSVDVNSKVNDNGNNLESLNLDMSHVPRGKERPPSPLLIPGQRIVSKETKKTVSPKGSPKKRGSAGNYDIVHVDDPTEVTNWQKLDPDVIGKNTQLLEFADQGTGDYRSPSFQVRYEDGSTLSPVYYFRHRILKGKSSMPEFFPNIYLTNLSEATTLVLELHDFVTGLVVELHYTVMHDYNAICRHVVFINNGDSSVSLQRVMSSTVDFDTDEYFLTQLSGSWARERQVVQTRLLDGITAFQSGRGASSHQHNPFAIISSGTPNEEHGAAFGFSLLYSGNFQLEAEISETGRLRVNLGINPQGFAWNLEPGESFCSPECVLVFSDEGIGGISRELHRLFCEHLIPQRWRNFVPPVLINTWEAVYFNISHEVVIELASKAKELGIELIVLDDGWFGHRNDTTSSLGDWYPNLQKLPYGLAGLSKEIHSMGLQFGLWFEPEMVSRDSELYSLHPDWCLHIPARGKTVGRNQLVLDFSRSVVRDYIFSQLSNILSSCPIEYIKWDMNRHLTEVFSQDWPASRQGEIAHRYVLGVYELLGRITNAFPHIIFETCSGGGGRFDAGMLYFAPQIWASDNTDAVSRIYIQYGTTLAYPICCIGSHVSTVPNHQTLRSTSMKTRSLVAMCGTFGYELDPRQLSEDEKGEIAAYIQLYKRLAHLIRKGNLYRLWNPFLSSSAAWMFVNNDASQALVFAFNIRREVGRLLPRLLLRGLCYETVYEVEELCPGKLVRNIDTGAIMLDPRGVYQYGENKKLLLSGRTLCCAGLPVKFLFDADSVLFELKAVTSALSLSSF
ncbi:alpha-galactosidase isoform 1 [Galdieria sulphuraria]|uniref:alpha-galactosidase n=1 Tax=Galdieria sulphuraria TaxID=130081 RepID=M2VWR1_GALSU|nr:alpha-galactosidase isoform 1 [Galdieria sulphuraria]EME27686.1 alpha-galactosidase isoform 1 [Galdieria sulphuraria]|eukprot:XP_005704206.1 alpha-galactosidase isoform 1 [Galdieria sulphuraria]